MTLRKNITRRWTVSFMAVTLLMAVTVLMAVALPLPFASADETLCNGDLPALAEPYDTVKVESGDSCDVLDDVVINGSFLADGADVITIAVGPGGERITIGGDIIIKGSTGDTSIQRVDVGGDVKIENQEGGLIRANMLLMGGSNIDVKNNVAVFITVQNDRFSSGGNILVEDNTSTSHSTAGGFDFGMRVRNNGDGGSLNPDNITVKNNRMTLEAGTDLLVTGNKADGNIEVEKNMATRDIVVGNNEFFADEGDNGGNLTVKENEADNDILVEDNGGSNPTDIQVEKNTANKDGVDGGVVDVTGNTANEKIQCKDNTPDPTGIDNEAPAGETSGLEDQCADLG